MYTKSGARLNGNWAIAIVIQMIGGELNNATATSPSFMGFGLLTAILQAALVIAFIWLMIKLSRVLGAYESKLKAKT